MFSLFECCLVLCCSSSFNIVSSFRRPFSVVLVMLIKHHRCLLLSCKPVFYGYQEYQLLGLVLACFLLLLCWIVIERMLVNCCCSVGISLYNYLLYLLFFVIVVVRGHGWYCCLIIYVNDCEEWCWCVFCCILCIKYFVVGVIWWYFYTVGVAFIWCAYRYTKCWNVWVAYVTVRWVVLIVVFLYRW